jgi:hypothetical protein
MANPAPDAELAALVDQLASPQTRRFARLELKRRRETAAFIACLASPNESVAWAAVQSLAELKAQDAVGPLVELLERRRLALDVSDALTAITGQDFGVDAARWRMWLTSRTAVASSVTPPQAAGPATSVPAAEVGAAEAPRFDFERCVRKAAELLAAEPAGSDKTFAFRLDQPGGRSQQVHVYQGRTGRQGEPLAIVYSECGPAEERHHAAALRRNCQLPMGAFGIRDVKGVPTLVLVETLPASVLTPRILARAIENIASRADLVEKDVAGDDVR